MESQGQERVSSHRGPSPQGHHFFFFLSHVSLLPSLFSLRYSQKIANLCRLRERGASKRNHVLLSTGNQQPMRAAEALTPRRRVAAALPAPRGPRRGPAARDAGRALRLRRGATPAQSAASPSTGRERGIAATNHGNGLDEWVVLPVYPTSGGSFAASSI